MYSQGGGVCLSASFFWPSKKVKENQRGKLHIQLLFSLVYDLLHQYEITRTHVSNCDTLYQQTNLSTEHSQRRGLANISVKIIVDVDNHCFWYLVISQKKTKQLVSAAFTSRISHPIRRTLFMRGKNSRVLYPDSQVQTGR